MPRGDGSDFRPQHFFHRLWCAAVDRHLNSQHDERVVDVGQLVFKRQQSIAAGHFDGTRQNQVRGRTDLAAAILQYAYGLAGKAEASVARKRWKDADRLSSHALRLSPDCVPALLAAGHGPEATPMTGHGYREAALVLAGDSEYPLVNRVSNPHNLWIELLGQYGIVGIGTVALMIGAPASTFGTAPAMAMPRAPDWDDMATLPAGG